VSISISDDDLKRMAQVTLTDLAEARAWWRQYAPRADRLLLEQGTSDTARCLRSLAMVERATWPIVDGLYEQLQSSAIDAEAWLLGVLHVMKMNAACGIAASRGGWADIRAGDLA
jgi:hypothetical protein